MIYKVSNLPLSLDTALEDNDALLNSEIAAALGVSKRALSHVTLIKRSVDARKKSDVHFVVMFSVEIPDDVVLHPKKGVRVEPYQEPRPLVIPDCSSLRKKDALRPVVVGTGPAGLFAALYLARAGLRPIVLERGASVDERMQAIAAFNEGQDLNVLTNVQFGEGGAGTFSDGKLNTGTKSEHIRHVLTTFVEAGAPEEILWQAKPHIGTDLLVNVVRAIREEIIACGGEVRFYSLFSSFDTDSQNCLTSIKVLDLQSNNEYFLSTDTLILACGHSARDTFEMMHDKGIHMERKSFAVGVRIEHLQEAINTAQYGVAACHKALGAADYKLAVHTEAGRGVYTFCMCPGGEVVAAASEKEALCVNGMSKHARAGKNANSALLVSIDPEDLPGTDVLEGVKFQRSLERSAYQLAYKACGKPYSAPAQTVGDFLSGKQGTKSTWITPTYPRGVAWVDLHDCLPKFVSASLEEAFPLLDRKLKGFAHPEAVMTGVEARSSSPVRMARNHDFQAELACLDELPSVIEGLYPCGEGAGYAGGIMSAAVDGLRVAEHVVSTIKDA